MFIEVPYEKLKGTRVKAKLQGKSKSFVPIAVCDSSNIADMLSRNDVNKLKMPIKYDGYTEILPSMLLDGHYVYIEKEIKDVDVSLELEIAQIDPRVHIVFKVPDDFINIKAVGDMCDKHPNIRFIGGQLANIRGVRVGIVDITEYSTKTTTNLPITTNGYEGYAPVFTYADVEDIHFTGVEKPVRVARPKKEKVHVTNVEEKEKKQPKKPTKKKSILGELL